MRSVRAAQEAATAAQQQQHKKQPCHKEETKCTWRRPHRPDETVRREATARSVYQNECECLHPLSSFLSFVMYTQPVSPFYNELLNCFYFFFLFLFSPGSSLQFPAVPLVLDICMTHERWGSSSDPSINGHWHYPNDLDRTLNKVTTDKIRSYHTDYNNRPSNDISIMSTIDSVSGCVHSEFVCLVFLQAHRETDLFFCRFNS